MIKGIDVSKYQKDIDFKKVKADGVDFVIIRAGFGKAQEDPYFVANIKGAIEAGLKVGVYWFVYAKTSTDIIANAKMCDATLRNFKDKLDLGVWCDFENDSDKYAGRTLSLKERTAWVKCFMDLLFAQGYKVGLYANPDYLDNKLGNLSQYSLWLAWYTDKKEKIKKYTPYIWQYTSKGKVNGIKGYVDMNYLFDKEETLKDTVTKKGIVATNGSNLMLRAGKSTKDKILARIPNGSEIEIVETGDWYKVIYGDTVGYCFGKYVSEV